MTASQTRMFREAREAAALAREFRARGALVFVAAPGSHGADLPALCMPLLNSRFPIPRQRASPASGLLRAQRR